MTNPSPEQVEAAAVALYEAHCARGDDKWEDLSHGTREHYRKDARAALVAAAGAAPQPTEGRLSQRIEALDEKHTPILAWSGGAVPEPSHEVCSNCGDGECTFGAELHVILAEFHIALAAPVVDESKLAEALRFCTCSHWLEAHHERACLEFGCSCVNFQPVLSIDENKLAEVLGRHILGEPNGGTASWAWVNCSCSHRVEVAGATREHVLKLGRAHQARAVAEWLRGDA